MGNICAFAGSVRRRPAAPSGQDLDGGGTNGVQAPEAHVQREIASQPDCWARALQSADEAAMVLPGRGERVAVTRSGTTVEVLDALRDLRGRARRIGITADPATPIRDVTDQLLVLDYAD